MTGIMHWLFDCENPFKLFGFWPVVVWLYYGAVVALWFGAQEWLGMSGSHGAVPFTYVLRCLPRIVWIAAAALAIWHFDLVNTVLHGRVLQR